jgi:UDP-N-acetylglucosamine 2-epimerase (non-hydrolysing)/GDP/UDP-N,N'-diacetylbacillosamine 2-epimerase (hydrolysing)
MRLIEQYAKGKEHVKVFVSLGQTRYLATLALVDAVVGNSSSGLYEAPSVRTPTVNIGSRQQGRLRAKSVFDCEPDRASIASAIQCALAFGRQNVVNPYDAGDCASAIKRIIKSTADFRSLVMKSFYDTNGAPC